VEHRGVVNAVRDMVTRLRLGPMDVWTAVATVTSDDAALEIWGSLSAGARLELLESTTVGDGGRLAAGLRAAARRSC
jgi:non-ribosomal peptide synthetase component F